ncbi:hypothetical protein Q5P01_002742 [Channa striata]|uniref:Uncharacterized protein n=1 Tax=Channa striata TaxID=64152 RepID=A0AA88T8D8_CHASR|nr:hypothetical protein Q5P01_002742 [Channa striata]
MLVSYLLVAVLPGEVQEARGEQLVFAPGTAVHGVRQPRGVEESAEFQTGASVVCVRRPSTRVSVCLCLGSCPPPSAFFSFLLFSSSFFFFFFSPPSCAGGDITRLASVRRLLLLLPRSRGRLLPKKRMEKSAIKKSSTKIFTIRLFCAAKRRRINAN